MFFGRSGFIEVNSVLFVFNKEFKNDDIESEFDSYNYIIIVKDIF